MSGLTGFDDIVRQGEPLAPYTWFKIGGPAAYIAEPRSIDELGKLVRQCREQELPVRMIGGGSNVLIRDEGVPGVVLRLSSEAFAEVKLDKDTITSGGGTKLGHLISIAVREGLAGLESLVGIPGTVGGALHGNAGGRGGDIGQWTSQASVMTRDGEIHERRREDLVFSYRESSLDELVILEAKFQLEPTNSAELTKRMQKQWILKKASQPLGHQSAGCIFKNPRGMSAGMLIDQAGLKGTSVGGAIVSERHANFIVTEPGASSQHVLKLIDLVKSRVSERLGVELETEIEVW